MARARGCYDSEKTRQKMSKSAKAARARGTHSSEETRQKRSEALKARWKRGEFADMLTDENVRRKRSCVLKAAWARGCFDSRETQQKMSEAAKSARARGCYDGVFQSPTNIEIAISRALDELGIMHVQQYRPDSCRFTYDEYLLAQGILLEVNGDYWHTKEGAPE